MLGGFSFGIRNPPRPGSYDAWFSSESSQVQSPLDQDKRVGLVAILLCGVLRSAVYGAYALVGSLETIHEEK